MPRSVEASLFAALKEIQRVAGRPVAGGSVPPSLEWSAAEIYGVVANWSPGGVDDPLELGAAVFTDYVAVGDTPATTGAVRLSYGGFIVERNEEDDGDIPLIGVEPETTTLNIDPDRLGITIGDPTDGSRIEIGDTPNNLFINFRGRSLQGPGAATAAGAIQFQTHEWDGGNLINSNTIVPYWDGDNATIILALQSDTSDFAFGADGALYDPFRPAAGSLGKVDHAWNQLFLAEYIQTQEMAAPAAPAANGVRIFAQDNGAGKTQLMAIFSSGAAQQLAIQP